MLEFLMPFIWKRFGISNINPHWLFGHDWNVTFDTDVTGQRNYHDTMRCPCGTTKQITEKIKDEFNSIPIKMCEACFPNGDSDLEAQHIH